MTEQAKPNSSRRDESRVNFYESILYRISHGGVIDKWASPVEVVVEDKEGQTSSLFIKLHGTGEKRLITHIVLAAGVFKKVDEPNYSIGEAKIQRDASKLTDSEIDQIVQIGLFGKVVYETDWSIPEVY